jgi:DNA-binding IclR family transcriptional regulator
MRENNVREKIIEALKEHPEGLTILNISKIIAMNRITTSKYVYGLMAEDMLYQREIGRAKMCYLKVRK